MGVVGVRGLTPTYGVVQAMDFGFIGMTALLVSNLSISFPLSCVGMHTALYAT